MLSGHDAIVGVDIGGTNIRAGIVLLNRNSAKDFSKANVWRSELWRHADDAPNRDETALRLVDMLDRLISRAEKEKLNLAPFIGIGCPGIIQVDGSISRGGQNLPGGNWESDDFNLPVRIATGIPKIDGHQTFVLMHNDASCRA